MMDRDSDRDVVLGKSLAETAELNSPEQLAGAAARSAVQRAGPDAERLARNRRGFSMAMLILFLVLASFATIAWLTGRLTQGS